MIVKPPNKGHLRVALYQSPMGDQHHSVRLLLHTQNMLNQHSSIVKHQVSLKSSVLRSMGQKQGSLWEIVLYINLLLASMRNT